MTNSKKSSRSNLGRPFSAYLLLFFAVFVAGLLAQFIHDSAMERMGIPFPDNVGIPTAVRLLERISRIAALAYLFHLSHKFFADKSTLRSVLIFGAAYLGLTETIRDLVVDFAVTNGLQHNRWVYLLLARVPKEANGFYAALAGVLIIRLVGRRPWWARYLAVLFAAAVGLFVVAPGSHWLTLSADCVFRLVQPPEVHEPPYGPYIYSFIYGTMLEPALACLFLASIVLPALKKGQLRRIVIFTVLMLFATGNIVWTGLYSFWLRMPYRIAVISEGQFLFEAATLSALVAFAWLRWQAWMSQQC